MTKPFTESFNEICGAIHLHTTFSDGGVSYQELIDAANVLGLDFIIVTDHMTLGGKDNGYEGFHNKLCAIVGYEHQDTINHNHYLVIGVDRVFHECTKPDEYVSAVNKAGGIGFLAHPAEKRHYFGNLPPYPWTAWDVSGFDGIEIWNQMSAWIEQIRSLFSAVRLFYPRRFLIAPPEDLMRRWDSLNKQRFVSGIGGVDAHTRRVGKGVFSKLVFPIKVELKGIRTHLYLNSVSDEFLTMKEKILQALKDGKGFFSNYRRGDAKGTKMFIEYSDGSHAWPGRSEFSSIPAQITVEIPEKGTINLLTDSKKIRTVRGKNATFDLTSEGIYRIEIYRKSKAWIYSNPFPVGKYPFVTH